MTGGFYHLTGFPLVARYTEASEVVDSANLDQYISKGSIWFLLIKSTWIIFIND